METEGFQSLGALAIVRKFCIALWVALSTSTTSFGIKNYEVDDVSVDRILAAKFIAR